MTRARVELRIKETVGQKRKPEECHRLAKVVHRQVKCISINIHIVREKYDAMLWRCSGDVAVSRVGLRPPCCANDPGLRVETGSDVRRLSLKTCNTAEIRIWLVVQMEMVEVYGIELAKRWRLTARCLTMQGMVAQPGKLRFCEHFVNFHERFRT